MDTVSRRAALLVALGLVLAGCSDAPAPSRRAAATPAAPRVAAAEGCAAAGPVTVLPPRVAAEPASPVPFFARSSGTLPADGPATVAGVRLPVGSRCPGYWSTDAPVPHPLPLVRRLAHAFPQTGLWPLVWTSVEDPDAYAESIGDPDRANQLDVARILHQPRLATGVDHIGTGWLNPFRDRESYAAVVLLVPVNRPADVLSLLGGVIATQYFTDAKLTAVVRSWEERFGAVVATIGPGTLSLTAEETPIMDPKAAKRLAREFAAFAPDDVDDTETTLQTATWEHEWSFGWPD